MYYKDMYDNISPVRVLEMAKKMLNCSESYVDPETDQEHYSYFLWQTRKKISEIMETVDAPWLQVSYDCLINRNAYLLYAKNSVGRYDMTPHELNMKREEAMQAALDRMEDVPVSGYDEYAIIKFIYNTETERISLSGLRTTVASTGRLASFLWYDFNNRENSLMFPIITW